MRVPDRAARVAADPASRRQGDPDPDRGCRLLENRTWMRIDRGDVCASPLRPPGCDVDDPDSRGLPHRDNSGTAGRVADNPWVRSDPARAWLQLRDRSPDWLLQRVQRGWRIRGYRLGLNRVELDCPADAAPRERELRPDETPRDEDRTLRDHRVADGTPIEGNAPAWRQYRMNPYRESLLSENRS